MNVNVKLFEWKIQHSKGADSFLYLDSVPCAFFPFFYICFFLLLVLLFWTRQHTIRAYTCKLSLFPQICVELLLLLLPLGYVCCLSSISRIYVLFVWNILRKFSTEIFGHVLDSAKERVSHFLCLCICLCMYVFNVCAGIEKHTKNLHVANDESSNSNHKTSYRSSLAKLFILKTIITTKSKRPTTRSKGISWFYFAIFFFSSSFHLYVFNSVYLNEAYA